MPGARMTEDRSVFDVWLDEYGRAWEARDSDRFGRLFGITAQYFWTPLETPLCGRAEITSAFRKAISRQQDIGFGYEVLASDDARVIARWRCSFRRLPEKTPVSLDGILVARFSDHGCCDEFREWWHSSETGAKTPRGTYPSD